MGQPKKGFMHVGKVGLGSHVLCCCRMEDDGR